MHGTVLREKSRTGQEKMKNKRAFPYWKSLCCEVLRLLVPLCTGVDRHYRSYVSRVTEIKSPYRPFFFGQTSTSKHERQGERENLVRTRVNKVEGDFLGNFLGHCE